MLSLSKNREQKPEDPKEYAFSPSAKKPVENMPFEITSDEPLKWFQANRVWALEGLFSALV